MKSLARLPFAPVVGVMFALVAAILVIATPQFLFERMVSASGLPSLLSAAAPPLGEKARIATALLMAAIVGGLIFAILTQIEAAAARRRPLGRGGRIDAAPAAAGLELVHVSPPRPIFAGSDLGAPFMSDEAMTLAREELLLAPAMIAEPVDAAPLTSAGPSQTVAALLGSLEDALERRQLRVGSARLMPGDMASLRSALGMPIAA